MDAADPLVLRWGRDLDNWPLIKLRMAAAQLNDLGCDIDIWNLEHPILITGELSQDRRVVELRISDYPSPPAVHWSALLGNAIASMRAAADSFAWQLAHLDGRKPPRPKDVYFPMSRDPKVWKGRVSALGDIHDDLVCRFAELRDSHNGSWLEAIATMAELNNVDKHQSSLQVTPDFSRLSVQDFEISFPPDHGGMTTNFEALTDLERSELGDVVGRFLFSAPVSGVSGTGFGAVSPRLEQGPVQLLSRTMHSTVEYAFEYLRGAIAEGEATQMDSP